MADGSRGLCLVTGCAGFIGSHLAERLLGEGYAVLGVDAFVDYYSRALKEHNLAGLWQHPRFRFVEGELTQLDLESLLAGVRWVFHQAAQAGVRASWGRSFRLYTELNILATQQLLEACRQQASELERFVYASSSSVYGDSTALPLREDGPVQPASPYGVSKLAGEFLARLYAANYGLPTVSLRYFTVYGPRQRPDMAFTRFLQAIYTGGEIEVYGDGEQTRDFTYIADAVEANLLAMSCPRPGAVYNIGGGSRVTVNHCLEVLGRVTGRRVRVRHAPAQHGDVRHTWADTTAAQRELGFAPHVTLEEGLAAQDAWFRERQAAPRNSR